MVFLFNKRDSFEMMMKHPSANQEMQSQAIEIDYEELVALIPNELGSSDLARSFSVHQKNNRSGSAD